MTRRRVVVTGLGLLTPLGLTVEASWEGIKAGKSGVKPITRFDTTGFSVTMAAELKNFDPTTVMPAKDCRKSDPFPHFGLATSHQALNDAGIIVTDENAHRIGVAFGSGIGGIDTIEKTVTRLIDSGPRKVSPFFIPGAIANMAAGNISMAFGLKGPNISIVTACTTGTHNIGTAARMIAYGDADVMLAGGSEMATTPVCVAGFAACRALSTNNTDPEGASRPWDKDRDGFVLGEGAGVLILEEYEHAKQRGANIYAELAGFGMSADAYHITTPSPNGEGAQASMTAALHDAHLNPEDIGYINAHATATPAGDDIEVRGIKSTFKEHAYRIPVSSTKSMTGHLLGAAGAIEAIFSILALRDQIAPPTINLDNPSPDCDLNLVPHTTQTHTINAVLSNSFGFGGTNGTLIFKKV